MEINVYKGEWGLPSIDFDCIRLLTYIKLIEAPVKITQGNPFHSPNSFLPVLVDNNKKVCGYNKIVNYLNLKNYNVNKNLTLSESFLSSGLVCYIEKYLSAYFQYTLWADPKNVDDTKLCYAKRTPFPFNFFYPRKYTQKASYIIESIANFDISDKIEFHDTDDILTDAKKCINLLSKRLDNKKWFINNKFSEFDTNVYAYLSILLNINLPNNPLQAHLKECPNLVKYVERITKTYFIDESYSSPEYNKKQTNLINEEDPLASSKSVQIVAGLGAFFAMIGYAIFSGLLSIRQYDDDEFNEGYIEYENDSEDNDYD